MIIIATLYQEKEKEKKYVAYEYVKRHTGQNV